MSHYDDAAPVYDGLFTRDVDRWEDERLAELLAPVVDGRSVLDLGCGTGWLLDHLSPREYTGVDCSGPMLAELERKHPGAETIKAEVGAPGWVTPMWLHLRQFEVITATWSLEYLGDWPDLLHVLANLAAQGGAIALHGSLPRGHRRAHFSVKAAPYRALGPYQMRAASDHAGLPRPAIAGTSALPDSMAGLGRWWWRTALAWPAGLHYSALWTWRLP